MNRLEIDMIVLDTLEALALYERIFEVEKLEVGDFIRGQNGAVFNIYGTRFHLLDENPDFNMFALKSDDYIPIWFNIAVPDINEVFSKAIEVGCTQITPVTDMPLMGVKNAMFKDPFGYVWMLHQIDKEVSFEERSKILETQGFKRR
ncbi:MAG: VOC family protein [Defluviitaleaceae bacterium]|nr:VOC family protein [Defluviitaleaceae bacterium]